MKHILICLLCTVVLFSYIGRATVPGDGLTAASQGNSIARVAVAATTPQSKERKVSTKSASLQVGILLGHADDLATTRFKNTFEKGLPTELKVNSVDTSGSVETQKTMFEKMVSSSYNLIVMEMLSTSPAEYFIDMAGQAGIPMIIIGEQPPQELLTRYPGIYYIGFSGDSLTSMMAAETFGFWKNNPDMMNFEKDEWDLSYSAVTSTGFDTKGYSSLFESAMSEHGVTTQFEVDSVVRHFDYNLHKEIDQTIIKDSEIIFFDNSTEAQKTINYFYDPTEFKKRPKVQIALSVIDDGAIKLIEEGEVLFACGADNKHLGTMASRLAQLLMAGQVPGFQNLELEPVNERSFFLPYTVMRADIPPEPVEEPDSDD